MTAIYFSDEPNQLRQIYTKRIHTVLEKEAALPHRIFRKEDGKENPCQFSTVESIFSTWGMPQMTEEEIAQYFPRLKYVFYAAGSVQSFARPFLRKGVRVFSAAEANAIPVAEYAAAAILLANKGFFQAARIHEHKDKYAHSVLHPGNYGAIVGIIGAGKIGSLVIEKLSNIDVQTVVYDPFCTEERAAALGAKKISLSELFEKSDVISNHLPNNASTVGMLNYDLFSRMKPWATFLNTGRGAQVVEEDLIRAMREKPQATAILDVTWPEPCPPDHPFRMLQNVFLTPHIAGSMNQETERMAQYMLEEWERIQKGEPPHYEVSLDSLENMA